MPLLTSPHSKNKNHKALSVAYLSPQNWAITASAEKCAHTYTHTHTHTHIYTHAQNLLNMPLFNKNKSHKALSVAYLTSEWGDNSVGREMHAVITHHARSASRIRATCLDINAQKSAGKSDQNGGNTWRINIQTVCQGGLVDLSEGDDIQAARKVNGMKFHILVDLNGWMPGSRAGILALRPTAVQVR
jgi:predicted O-linked N-acetylglucosamine transferase (SPINDLY family)